MSEINFEAEVKSVSVNRIASGDKEIKIVLLTNQEQALQLQKYIANDTIKIQIA